MRRPRLLVAATQVPFHHGGAEILVESLVEVLRERGFEVDVVRLPFQWEDRRSLLRSALAWRLFDLGEVAGRRIDRVIATRFPSYLLPHPQKVVWLIHQFRQVYDLLGTPYSDFGDSPEDQRMVRMVRAMDERGLAEAKGLYAISENVAARLQRFNQLPASVLYPPPKLDGHYRCGDFGDYVFTAGRLNRIKRFDLLIEALRHTKTPVRCKIAGSGPEDPKLARLARELGVADRVDLLGWVDEPQLVELYADCLAVFYAPFDEDYGYVTLEAIKSGKPVLTTHDAGGVLEFVRDGRNGYVCSPGEPRHLAGRLDELFLHRERARELGSRGDARVRDVTWDRVVSALTGWREAPE